MRADPQLSFPGAVLSRSEHWIAIDKPAGLLSRPGPGHGTSVLAQLEDWLRREEPGAPAPGVVHRLDRDTSGVLLFSLGPEGHRSLTDAFASRRMRKEYLAVVAGLPRPRRGRIDLPLRRDSSGRVVPNRNGQPASTRYETLRAARGASLLRVFPLSGRMHQIRVHLAARGTPILGDPIYGSRKPPGLPELGERTGLPETRPAGALARRAIGPRRLCLHASAITLPSELLRTLGLEPPGALRIRAPLPDDLREFLERLTLSGQWE